MFLQELSNATYASDYDFHSGTVKFSVGRALFLLALSALLTSLTCSSTLALAVHMATLQDAHTIYAVPAGYRSFATLRPFSIVSRLINGTQLYYSATSLMSASLYTALGGSENLEDFYGRQILYIDSEPVDQYLETMGKNYGLYLDAGAQVNNLLSSISPFPFQTTAFTSFPSDKINIVFAGDFVGYEFQNFMTTSQIFTSVNDIIALNKPSAAKRSSDGSVSDSFTIDETLVLNLLDKQAARTKASSSKSSDQSTASLQAHAEKLRASLLNAQKTGAERRAHQAVTPIVRYQNVISAWSAYLAAEVKAPAIDTSIYPESDRIVSRETYDFAVNTTAINITSGAADYLVSYQDTAALSYWSYEDTTVIRLKSFFPADVASFQKLIKTVSNSRSSNGLGKNLILDVSGNTGGYVCASYFALSYLSRAWNKASLTGNDILFSPYDFRQSSLTDELYARGYFGTGVNEISDVTRKSLGASFYTDRVSQTYEGYTSNYTQRYLWNLCEPSNYKLSESATVFDKILIVSDGRCGSACSYFISKLRIANKARVMTYGGIWGKQMDSSAFAGGNVYEWSSFVTDLASYGTFSWAKQLPTSAVTAFNFREMYNPGESYPRQFTPMYADWVLPYWDPLLGSTSLSDSSQKEALATLYASALTVFDKIPSGLLGTNSNKALAIVLALVGIAIAGALTAALVIAIIANCRTGNRPEYDGLSPSEF